MNIKRIFIALTVLQSFSPSVFPQSLQFYREDIVFKLNNNAMETDAVYHFCDVGDKDISTQLFYPFPENTMELIDSIVVTNDKTGEIIHYRDGKNGILFGIFVKSYGQASYRVFFRQKLLENKFTYILTSTETWNRALEFANYEFQAPVATKITSFSFPPDSTVIQHDIQYFYWKKKDFMPEKDFEVIFR
jgi:hypothetical protein